MSIRKIIIFILAIVCGCGVTIKKTNAKIVRITVKEKKLCLKNPTNYTQNLGLNTYRKKERKLERWRYVWRLLCMFVCVCMYVDTCVYLWRWCCVYGHCNCRWCNQLNLLYFSGSFRSLGGKLLSGWVGRWNFSRLLHGGAPDTVPSATTIPPQCNVRVSVLLLSRGDNFVFVCIFGFWQSCVFFLLFRMVGGEVFAPLVLQLLHRLYT